MGRQIPRGSSQPLTLARVWNELVMLSNPSFGGDDLVNQGAIALHLHITKAGAQTSKCSPDHSPSVRRIKLAVDRQPRTFYRWKHVHGIWSTVVGTIGEEGNGTFYSHTRYTQRRLRRGWERSITGIARVVTRGGAQVRKKSVIDSTTSVQRHYP